MKNRLTGIFLLFVSIFLILTVSLYFVISKSMDSFEIGEQKVILNEIRQLSGQLAKGANVASESYEENDEAEKHEEEQTISEDTKIACERMAYAVDELERNLSKSNFSQNRSLLLKITIGFFSTGVLFLGLVFFYINQKIMGPFQKLEDFAEEVASGNLETPLLYERTNFFGAFTWAFDHMRKEIKYAKEKEAAAIEDNKTIIASLSHDIKTPIASIRAYSEGLEANLDASFEKRQKYASTIMRKCDEVTALVNDLVIHSLSELEKLTIEIEEVKMQELLAEFVLDAGFSQVKLKEPVDEKIVLGDSKRIIQILENLINNARKYAKGSDIEIFTEVKECYYAIYVKDHGKGIDPGDLPFIQDKFYRGKNVGDMPGSGLGLYIVDYLVKQMHGEMVLHNSDKGLTVEVCLPQKKG